jgi:hypothetical protein
MELAGTAWLIKSTLQPFKPQFELFNVSFSKAFQDRGWIPASALGLLVVLLSCDSFSKHHPVFFTSTGMVDLLPANVGY